MSPALEISKPYKAKSSAEISGTLPETEATIWGHFLMASGRDKACAGSCFATHNRSHARVAHDVQRDPRRCCWKCYVNTTLVKNSDRGQVFGPVPVAFV